MSMDKDLENLEHVYVALIHLLYRITKEGWPSGNPYSVPEVKAGLQAIAKARGLKGKDAWYDAVN